MLFQNDDVYAREVVLQSDHDRVRVRVAPGGRAWVADGTVELRGVRSPDRVALAVALVGAVIVTRIAVFPLFERASAGIVAAAAAELLSYAWLVDKPRSDTTRAIFGANAIFAGATVALRYNFGLTYATIASSLYAVQAAALLQSTALFG
jgi:hypothetical protein